MIYLMNLEQLHMTTDPQSKSNDLCCKSTRMAAVVYATVTIYCCLASKTDIHFSFFTIPRRVEG